MRNRVWTMRPMCSALVKPSPKTLNIDCEACVGKDKCGWLLLLDGKSGVCVLSTTANTPCNGTGIAQFSSFLRQRRDCPPDATQRMMPWLMFLLMPGMVFCFTLHGLIKYVRHRRSRGSLMPSRTCNHVHL